MLMPNSSDICDICLFNLTKIIRYILYPMIIKVVIIDASSCDIFNLKPFLTGLLGAHNCGIKNTFLLQILRILC